ncbi:hypothetical protein Taro_029415 [Colocasia esculenta]|uniref:Methyltransferase n=1 Tax=Colocasia esculenta TaxID=4460 RepID=A0A843VIW3_COLES|nr:hypothetical protein [Colocasia esculenta]
MDDAHHFPPTKSPPLLLACCSGKVDQIEIWAFVVQCVLLDRRVIRVGRGLSPPLQFLLALLVSPLVLVVLVLSVTGAGGENRVGAPWGGGGVSDQVERTRSSVSIFIVVGLCCFFYVLGAWQKSGFGKGDSIAVEITRQTASTDCGVTPNLNFETHHDGGGISSDISESKVEAFEPCDEKYTDYTPCQDQRRAMTFPRNNMIYRERHCPPEDEKLRCLIPPPKGYVTPFPWPKSRDYVPFANCPYKSLTVEKAVQNWVQYEGNVFRFPGGGTQFPQGADKYIEQLASVIPITNGTVRTALDTGCGVASWGAYLLKRNVLAMSFAPRDSHEAQVQFALERGVPAVIGVLGSIQLPYPSRAFDMAHCSRCLIPWSGNDGMYMMEVDRVLRPGGYWVLSGPPINWKTNHKAWQRTEEDLSEEQRKIEEFAELLCWEKISEKGEIAVWRKRINAESCPGRQDGPRANLYKKMETCVTPYPEVNNQDEVAGGELKAFPERLNAVPPRIASGSVPGVSVVSYQEDNRLWKKHVAAYKKINKYLDTGRYRNIMDMNAGLGGFAAAMESSKLWVMNVVPTIAEKSTLGVIYERGLIGIYHDWYVFSHGSYVLSYLLLRHVSSASCLSDSFSLLLLGLSKWVATPPEGAHHQGGAPHEGPRWYTPLVGFPLVGATTGPPVRSAGAHSVHAARSAPSLGRWQLWGPPAPFSRWCIPLVSGAHLGFPSGGVHHRWYAFPVVRFVGRCEAFSTYPRTYDLIHANGVFSLYQGKCSMEDILLEMDRILRPEGAVIFRDEVDSLIKVKKIASGMRWNTKMVDHEDGPLVPEKIFVAVKQYWVGGGNITTDS